MSRRRPETQAAHEPLAPLLAMVALLPPDVVHEIARALHAKLNAPPTAAKRRVTDLALLARLLDELPQHPGRLPYVPRNLYESRRSRDHADGPTSRYLQERFGSWQRACCAAWGLRDDGRCWAPEQPWPRVRRSATNYVKSEAVASVRSCTTAVGHIPSSHEYHHWVMNRRARARAVGGNIRPYVLHATVLRLLAADRSGGNGWQLVISRVFGGSPDSPLPASPH